MAAGGKDAVEPGLFVLMAWRGEGCARELLGVESVWWLLWGVAADRESSFDGFGFMIGVEAI